MTRNLNLIPRAQTRNAALAPASPTARWLAARGLAPGAEPWSVVIELDAVGARSATLAARSKLQVSIESRGWGVTVEHGGQGSSIWVTNVPRVCDRDDFGLVHHVTDPCGLRAVVPWIECRLGVRFRRSHARIKSTLPDADQKVLMWILVML
jgi:hypothetical protein